MSETLIRSFVDVLYPPEFRAGLASESGEPFLTISTADPAKKAGPLRSYHFRLSDPELEILAAHLDGQGLNVYHGVGLHGQDLGQKRGNKASVTALPGLWLDVDLKGPNHVATNLPPTIEAFAEHVLAKFDFEPSIAVATGGGVHLYWLFREPLLITDANRERVGKASKEFQGRLIELAAAVSASLGGPWHLDATADITRILRPVGTRNWKTPEGVPVEWVGDSTGCVRYAPEALGIGAGVSPFGPPIAPPVSAPALGSAPSREASTALVVSRLKPDRSRLDALIAQHRTQGPVGVPPPEEVAPAPDVSALAGTTAPTPFSFDELIAAATDQGALVGGPPIHLAELRKRLVIQHGETFYILRRNAADGTFHYGPGSQRGELPAVLREELAQWPRTVEHPSGDPADNFVFFEPDVMRSTGPRSKTTAEIVQELATVAEKGVTYDASIPRSYFDAGPSQLRLSVWQPRAELLARADEDPDPQIVQYFSLFESELLLDWLATSSRKPAEPTSILTIVGAPGAGKNMIAHGIARQWSDEGPVAAKQFLATFNNDFLRSPAVHIDEDLPTDPATGRRLTTARLREIAGESTFPIGIKFRSTASLKGAARLVVTINDLDAITTFNEDLNSYSLDAIASRFLIVKVSEKQTEFLKAIGGRAYTTDKNWPDRIAQYALHLAKYRKVERGSRFLVDGDGAALVGQMASSGSVASLILLAIAKHVRTPLVPVAHSGAIRFGGGRILVNGDALVGCFADLLPDERRPAPRLLLKALTPLCDGEAVRPRDDSGKRLRYRALKLDNFYSWADTQDIDVEVLKARIGAPEGEVKAKVIGIFSGGKSNPATVSP